MTTTEIILASLLSIALFFVCVQNWVLKENRKAYLKLHVEFAESQGRSQEYLQNVKTADEALRKANAALGVEVRQRETEFIAAVLILEAVGEGPEGMRAVASVIRNRQFGGETARGVVTTPGQFSALKGRSPTEVVRAAAKIARPKDWVWATSFAGWLVDDWSFLDITNGSTYFSTAKKPKWLPEDYVLAVTIGKHNFFHLPPPVKK